MIIPITSRLQAAPQFLSYCWYGYEREIKSERKTYYERHVCYIFASLNPKIKQLAINEEIAEYRSEFNRCVKKGMKVIGVSLKLIDGEPIITSSLLVIT